MLSEEILGYIGMATVILFAVYYVYKVMQVQNDVIEGLTTQKQVTDAIAEGETEKVKQSMEKLSDTLLIKKYKNTYEDLVMDLEKVIDYNVITGLVHLSSKLDKQGIINMSNEATRNTVESLNNLYTLKQNLNSTMEFLDNES